MSTWLLVAFDLAGCAQRKKLEIFFYHAGKLCALFGLTRRAILHALSFFLSRQHFLLQQPGIDVHAKDDRGNTALDAARENDKLEVVQVLEEFSSSS